MRAPGLPTGLDEPPVARAPLAYRGRPRRACTPWRLQFRWTRTSCWREQTDRAMSEEMRVGRM
eukprot:716557-Alexandrium_andersonii.AAC.1